MPIQTIVIDKKITPSQIYNRISHLPYPILLESTLKNRGFGRYSFIAADPFLVFQTKGDNVKVNGLAVDGDSIKILRQLLNKYKLPVQLGFPPFTGGAIGYFSYDFGRQFEKLPNLAVDDTYLPDCILCFYDTVFTVDHFNNIILILSSGFPEEEKKTRDKRKKERALYFRNMATRSESINLSFEVMGRLKCHFDKTLYCNTVDKVKDYILAGDIFQANLSQRFSISFTGSPFGLYKRLSHINPAPFAAIIEWDDFAVVSASPERYLSLNGSLAESRPIKGTRPRGINPVDDEQLRQELWNSTKDRAELTMIIDLVRNDFGRVCIPGTVKVPELFRLEQYATVWHLISTIQGKLKTELDFLDIIKSSFPGGSITGAPKIRAMEIIEELEPVKRNIYTGSIGYIGFNGQCDFNIVIRTFIIKNDTAYIQVGGAITVDSDPALEYQETLDKAYALFQSLGSNIQGD